MGILLRPCCTFYICTASNTLSENRRHPFETRPNWARKVREMILFSILCTVYFGRGCVSLESEYRKEISRLVTNTRTDM